MQSSYPYLNPNPNFFFPSVINSENPVTFFKSSPKTANHVNKDQTRSTTCPEPLHKLCRWKKNSIIRHTSHIF
ncbi:hypothetical protein EYC80_005753 [Monilinia laxa]|uniref:Uncharacterized protein n=1 Tax=Monilinia laxa TaxID=61186 RepID=A0A5N6KEW3_MONLA|nr:hypothetical protein EYC80_005753 [Monilinia laxa]